MLPWIMLYLAIGLEISGTFTLKLSKGMSSVWLTLVALGCYGASLGLLGKALEHVDMSIAYALWSGIGMAAVACIGILYFKEALTPLKAVSLILVLLGTLGLNLSGTSH